jgi:hypothetical protein
MNKKLLELIFSNPLIKYTTHYFYIYFCNRKYVHTLTVTKIKKTKFTQ